MSLFEVNEALASACQRAGRQRQDVALLAVSKFQDAAKIEAVLKQGHRLFGENRVQEAEEKWPLLRQAYPDVRVHMIGHLQTNKAKDAVRLFDCIESVDSEKLADALKHEMEKQGRNLPCFLQVNTGEEEQKGGVAPQELESLYRHCKKIELDVRGLMCVPPAEDLPDMHFALLNTWARRLGLSQISAGMSGDFEAAILYGSTEVRIGSAIFGVRENN